MPNILIVDDSRTMRNIIKRGLRQAGLSDEHLVEAADAQAGLEALATQRVDLVLTDVSLPNIGGVELVERIRANFGDAPPTVLISIEGDDAVDGQAAAAGANAVVKKPFTPDQLGAAVRPLLSLPGNDTSSTS